MRYCGMLTALLLGVVLGLGISDSPAEASKTCNLKRCKAAIKARCAGLKRKAKRQCRKGIVAACKAGECSCTGGIPSCAEPTTTTTTTIAPVFTVTTTTVGTPTTTTSSSTTSTTLVSGECLVDTGDGTIHDTCTGLQWEKKVDAPGLQNVDTLYTWAGCCDGDCSTVANLCQPNAGAAATCAAHSDGGTEGCGTCVSGTWWSR